MRSIERYMLAWVAGTLSLGLIVVALVGYLVTLDEINEVFDADLKNVATAMASHRSAGFGPVSDENLPPPKGPATGDDSDIVTTTWTRQGQRLYSSDPGVAVPFSDVEGLSHPRIAGLDWIVYTIVRDDAVAQAAQPVASRQEMAGESAASIVPPMLGLALVASALMVFALRRGLHSLDEAARSVAARSERSLEPMPTESLPSEILPIVRSVNGLMVRLDAALVAQRRFLADAAHELRTPATALRLQLQLLERSQDEATRAAAMAALKSGVDRTQRLIEQLLQVARSGPDGEPPRIEDVDLAALVREVVSHLSIKAEHRDIDLGAELATEVEVSGDREQLTVLLNNLIENALRYTPAGGVVDVHAQMREGCPVLQVVDNGPGIPETERSRVFDRFYRCESSELPEGDSGSGLGLAIVKAIADQHTASVTLHTPDSGRGLKVEVVFPERRSNASS